MSIKKNTLLVLLKNFEFFRSFHKLALVLIEFFSFPKMFFSIRPSKEVIFVSAATETHELSIVRLIDSLRAHEPNWIPIIFDMGMSVSAKEVLAKKLSSFSKYRFESIDFASLPGWMNPRGFNNGGYAWKPYIIEKSLTIAKELLAQDSILLWMDAGNILTGDMRRIIKYTEHYKFWSTSSSGQLGDWTSNMCCKILDISSEELKISNLNGAAIAFNFSSNKSKNLFFSWLNLSSRQEVISPIDATMKNHRFDQSILTLLAIREKLFPNKSARDLSRDCIIFHQDIETYVKIWIR